jgi:hypothetical protein
MALYPYKLDIKEKPSAGAKTRYLQTLAFPTLSHQFLTKLCIMDLDNLEDDLLAFFGRPIELDNGSIGGRCNSVAIGA